MLNTVNLFIALVVAAITYGTPLLFGTLGEVLTLSLIHISEPTRRS